MSRDAASRSPRRALIVVVWLVSVALAVAPAGEASASQRRGADELRPRAQSQLQTVQIGEFAYKTGNVQAIAPLVTRFPAVSFALRVARACRTFGAHGFAGQAGGGFVIWLPANPLLCLGDVTGGGPGARPSGPCLQVFRTPGRDFFAMIAATSVQACADLSTQVPGGLPGRMTVAAGGLAAGAVLLIKCQLASSEGLLDYMAPQRSALPASKPTYLVPDAYVAKGVAGRARGVPSCSGVNVRL